MGESMKLTNQDQLDAARQKSLPKPSVKELLASGAIFYPCLSEEIVAATTGWHPAQIIMAEADVIPYETIAIPTCAYGMPPIHVTREDIEDWL